MNWTTQHDSPSINEKASEEKSCYSRKQVHGEKALSGIKIKAIFLDNTCSCSCKSNSVSPASCPSQLQTFAEARSQRSAKWSVLKACAVTLIWRAYSSQLCGVQMLLLRPKGSPAQFWHNSCRLKQPVKLLPQFSLQKKGLRIQKYLRRIHLQEPPTSTDPWQDQPTVLLLGRYSLHLFLEEHTLPADRQTACCAEAATFHTKNCHRQKPRIATS